MRSYITKIVLTAFVWLGMAMYLVRPVQAETATNSFASWLDTVVKKAESDAGNENLRQELYQLKKADESLNGLIQKASEIVTRHNEDFNLPLAPSNANSEMVYDLLIWEWNSFQTGNGMGKASVPTTIKSNFYPTLDKFVHSVNAAHTGQQGRYDVAFCSNVRIESHPKQSFNITPLSGGVAIGAP